MEKYSPYGNNQKIISKYGKFDKSNKLTHVSKYIVAILQVFLLPVWGSKLKAAKKQTVYS